VDNCDAFRPQETLADEVDRAAEESRAPHPGQRAEGLAQRRALGRADDERLVRGVRVHGGSGAPEVFRGSGVVRVAVGQQHRLHIGQAEPDPGQRGPDLAPLGP
jgi:hypothetical protein